MQEKGKRCININLRLHQLMELNKSGFKTKQEAEKAGIIAYDEYTQIGNSLIPKKM